MSDLTYETENTGLTLETYEWDNPWWEHTENDILPRIVYIGDSISNGTRQAANRLADGKILFDGFATSKSLDNPFYKKSLDLYLEQQGRRKCILFNNGLHGWHLSDMEYYNYYKSISEFLLEKNVPVYILLTTNLPDDSERNVRVISRNTIAAKIADEYGLKVIDLYDASLQCGGLYCGDGVHFKDKGYEILAERIIKSII